MVVTKRVLVVMALLAGCLAMAYAGGSNEKGAAPWAPRSP